LEEDHEQNERSIDGSGQAKRGKRGIGNVADSGGAAGLPAQSSTIAVRPERQATTMQSKFYCNTKALNPTERARHKQLSEKTCRRAQGNRRNGEGL